MTSSTDEEGDLFPSSALLFAPKSPTTEINPNLTASSMENPGDVIMVVYPETHLPNVIVLSAVLLLALAANLCALPVILFRRTKFGNGLFAVLILCLTFADLAVVFFSVLGSLVVEASHLLWGGAPGSCQIYHWLSAWLTGLSAYLLVAIVAMVMVKTTTSCLQRLRDCRWLLLALLVTSGLYAIPELLVRSTANLTENGDEEICIFGVSGVLYGLYVAFRLLLRHIAPAMLVIAAVVRPETRLSKRVSHLFFGHLTAPCSCGEDGAPLRLPHECPNMQSAMLKAAAASSRPKNTSVILNDSRTTTATMILNAHSASTSSSISSSPPSRPSTVAKPKPPPDVIAGHKPEDAAVEPIGFMRNGKVHKLLIQPEDPHRRRYKLLLAANFILVAFINVSVDLAFQFEPADNLATAAYAVSHLQQILDPVIFLAAEFLFRS